jgi:hypothetical protein
MMKEKIEVEGKINKKFYLEKKEYETCFFKKAEFKF